MQSRTLRTIGATVVLAGIAIAGIAQAGSPDDPGAADIGLEEQAGSHAEETATPETSAPSMPPERFTYRVGVLAPISTDNFWAYYGEEPSVWNSYVLGPTKTSLYTLDPATGTLTAELAAAEATPVRGDDGWEVAVPLREDFEWSDGTPITADDFVFTFETVRSLGLAGSWVDAYSDAIESVQVEEGNVLRIEFSERPTLAAWPHGAGLAPVMAEHIWGDLVGGITAEELYSMSGGSDVGGGPLTLVTSTDSVAVSTANPGYPEHDTPDVVEYHVYEDEETLVAAVGEGQIDSALTPKGLTRAQLADIADPVTVVESPANGLRYLGFNLTREPMSAPQFRRALALLLDRDGLAERIPSTGEAAWSILPEANTQWLDEEVVLSNQKRYGRGDINSRLERALEGLRKAGYAWETEPSISDEGALVAGVGLTIDGQAPQPLTILTSGDEYDPSRPEYVQEIAETIDILGFDTRPVETDFVTVVDLAFTRGEDGELHYDMYMLGWTLGSPALPDFYRHLFAAEGAMNNTGYSNKGFNETLTAYENAHTVEEAKQALWEMERILARDLPYLPLYTSGLSEVYRRDRVAFDADFGLGGMQGRLGGVVEVRSVND